MQDFVADETDLVFPNALLKLARDFGLSSDR